MSKTLIIPEMQILYRMCGLENDQAARKFYKPYKYLMHIHKQLTKKNIAQIAIKNIKNKSKLT